jgi:hypothetical protein
MSQLTEVIIKSGILSPEAIKELRRWKLPGTEVESPDLEAPLPPKILAQKIDEALQSEGYALTRLTDLEIVGQYLASMQSAVLHVVTHDGEADFDVHVGRTPLGEWIIPWKDEDISDVLTNGQTYLRVKGKRYFFGDTRELFYGHNKAFIIARHSTEEKHG